MTINTQIKYVFALLFIIIVENIVVANEGKLGAINAVMALMTRDRVTCRNRGLCPTIRASISGSITPCIGGVAGEYECNNIDLLSFVSLSDLGCTGPLSGDCDGNDMWGWTDIDDPNGIQLYAIAGTTRGTSFVRVTDPLNPVVVAFVPSRSSTSVIWRDIKVKNNYAYIVADRSGHHMQYFDLTRLRVLNSFTQLSDDGYFEFSVGNGRCHNVVIDENSNVDIAYLVGTDQCSGGLYVVDISTPNNPSDAGCFSSDGYTHDATCVTYIGPHAQYNAREICFAFNVDTLTIIDMTDPTNGILLSHTGYVGAEYVHQGWLSVDHVFLFLDDELDEMRSSGGNTGHARTHLFDVRDLTNPIKRGFHDQSVVGVDHNLYVKGQYIYETNYEAGLRILQYDGDGATGDISVFEVAYFDTYPSGNAVETNGAWSNYPFFDDFILVNDINRGLFILQLTLQTSSPTMTTNAPTNIPTMTTTNPSKNPTASPTKTPTTNPTNNPTMSTTDPSKNPTTSPTNIPSITPSMSPSQAPSQQTAAPSVCIPTGSTTSCGANQDCCSSKCKNSKCKGGGNGKGAALDNNEHASNSAFQSIANLDSNVKGALIGVACLVILLLLSLVIGCYVCKCKKHENKYIVRNVIDCEMQTESKNNMNTNINENHNIIYENDST